MGAINETCADVTALYKFYHTNREKFYPAVAGATEQPDEFYAVTLATGDTSSQSIIKFTKDENSAWESYALRSEDSTSSETPTAIATVTGTDSGMFARMRGKTYYTNGQDHVKQIRARVSSDDSMAKFLYTAGVPDPNAFMQFNSMDNTGESTYYNGAGAGSANVSLSVQHRREGIGAVVFTQETSSQTSILLITAITSLKKNWTKFQDGTDCGNRDFVAFEIYRFDKKVINEIEIRCGNISATGTALGTNYFNAYVCVTGTITMTDGTTWDNWAPAQTTVQAKWANNPYDNQIFRVRIRKDFFGKNGTASWTAIDTVQFSLKSGGNASTTRPAKIAIDNIRILKTPPEVKNFVIQCATMERTEDGSTLGWLANTATGAQAEFNYNFAREGMTCIGVPEDTTATLTFDSSKDLATYPDGTTSDITSVLRVNVVWKPFTNAAAWNFGNLTAPTIRFIDTGNHSAYCTMVTLGNLGGGGISKQVPMKLADTPATGDGTWHQGTGFDWTVIKKIKIVGPSMSGTSIETYYFDDLKIGRPLDAMRPVFIFEPIELFAVDLASEMAGSILKDYAWVFDLIGDGVKWLFGTMSWSTHGEGYMVYPDYEHSSIGIAGCTLNSYGSKAFGADFRFNVTQDLTKYTIPTVLWPWEWDPESGKFGLVGFTEIPASGNDKFSIWIAIPEDKIQQVTNISLKIYGDNGGLIDKENFLEYNLTTSELKAIVRQQTKNTKNFNTMFEDLKEGLNKNPFDVFNMFGGLMGQENADIFLPNQVSEIGDFVSEGLKALGRDRGGWPYGTFEWKRSDMITVESGGARNLDLTAVRGIGIEITGKAGGAQACFDNFYMNKIGGLSGKYWYKVMLEDAEGNLSAASEASYPVTLSSEDAVLSNVYVPTGPNKHRVKNKRIYRMGGDSTDWRHAGNCGVNLSKYFDGIVDDKMGSLKPPNAFMPPRCKVMKAIGNIMYFANITKDRLDEVYPYRMYKSEPFIPFRVRDFDAIDIPEDKGAGIVNFEEYYNQLAIWTPDSLWTIPVGFRGVPQHRSTKGLIARDTVAKSDYGLIWLSREGIMLGSISKVDENFFKPINKIFTDYIKANSEDALSDARGFVLGQYYYLFYDFDDTGTGKGVCCYLPERTFSELEGPFDMRSFCKWDGGEDQNDIYYGRSDGKIFKLFSGENDNGTAISTMLKTRDFSQPGIQYDKWLRAFYLSMGKMGSADSTIVPKVYINETSKDTMPQWTATTTTVQTFVQPAIQGDEGTHISVALSGSGSHKITEMVLKIEVEDDVERKI